MRIGIDLDNTIVRYDELFIRLVRESGLLTREMPPYKQAIRDRLRAAGQEQQWTILQGMAYGSRMKEAAAFPGVEEFLRRCVEARVEWFIISHRSETPYAGEPHDLHEAARNWLRDRGILTPASEHRVILRTTVAEKIRAVRDLECSVFVDDLAELLSDAAFPENVRRILFDPGNQNPDSRIYERAMSWDDVARLTGL